MKWTVFWMAAAGTAALLWTTGAGAQAPTGGKIVTEADCTAAKLGESIPVAAIGEPVSAVTVSAPRWIPAAKNTPAYCSVTVRLLPSTPRPRPSRSISR